VPIHINSDIDSVIPGTESSDAMQGSLSDADLKAYTF